MGKGREVSPVVAGIIIVIVVLIVGMFIWKETNRSTGVSGVGSTSAALAKPGKPAIVPMLTKPLGSTNSNIPMPGRTPLMPTAAGK